MKKRIILIFPILVLLICLTSCIGGIFEKELKVNFMCDDDLIGTCSITQFKNAQTPQLPETYIPDGYKFFGWTIHNPNKVKATDEDFKEKYIGAGKMIHYMDVAKYTKSSEVKFYALLIDKDEIPQVYHYCVLAWYDKLATSGISATQMETLETKLKAHLRNQGVSEADINTIIIRGYSGNVGPSCGAILADEDVDIMLGWSSANNVIETGGFKEEMLLETVSFQVTYNGTVKNRTIHRLTDKDTVKVVMAWLQSEECHAIFN